MPVSCLLPVRYKVAYKRDTGECKLEISMTFADDAGEYSVFAKNPLGEVWASAFLLEEGRPPNRLRTPTSCFVSANELSRVWFANRGV